MRKYNKIISIILLAVLMLSAVTVGSAESCNVVFGDADNSGAVNISDVTCIQQYAAGLVSPFEISFEAADVDEDKKITINDATYIQLYLASLPSPLDNKQPDNDTLYNQAVSDAVFADEDEVMPLVNITKDDENVIWNGDKVLVTFMHKFPLSYPAGDNIELQWGNVWCVSAGEMYKWVKSSGDVKDWTVRLHQILGMPTTKNYTHITAMWVDSDLLYRPANVTDPTAEMKTTYQKTGNDAFDKMYKAWFDSNIISSYFDGAYPWTRLGYTYDWANNGTEYGLSEFLIFNGARADIEYTYTIDEFVAYAKAQ